MKTRKIMLWAAAGICGLAGMASVAVAGPASPDEFLGKAINDSEFAVESSKLALEKSQDKDIKQYAQLMIESQTKIFDQLAAYRQSAAGADHKDKAHQEMMKRLEGLVTDNFNNEYSRMQKDTSKEMVTLFDAYAHKGGDANLKDFAAKILPQLEEYKAMADKLESGSGH